MLSWNFFNYSLSIKNKSLANFEKFNAFIYSTINLKKIKGFSTLWFDRKNLNHRRTGFFLSLSIFLTLYILISWCWQSVNQTMDKKKQSTFDDKEKRKFHTNDEETKMLIPFVRVPDLVNAYKAYMSCRVQQYSQSHTNSHIHSTEHTVCTEWHWLDHIFFLRLFRFKIWNRIELPLFSMAFSCDEKFTMNFNSIEKC